MKLPQCVCLNHDYETEEESFCSYFVITGNIDQHIDVAALFLSSYANAFRSRKKSSTADFNKNANRY